MAKLKKIQSFKVYVLYTKLFEYIAELNRDSKIVQYHPCDQ